MVKQLGRIMFAVAAAFLLLLAAALIFYAGYQLWKAVAAADQILTSGDFGYTIIDSVGYVVIAIAIIDVTKHVFEEEVVGWKEPDKESVFRRNFSKFISIISIAIFLEGLVLVFKVSQDDIRLLVYPVLLLLVGVPMTVGLAVFQWLGAEQRPRDEAQ